MTYEIPYRPCVGCGFCCKKTPCGFGEADETGSCRHLVVWENDALDIERYRCGKHEKIEGQPTADLSPAFGAGCCMSMFNESRARILAELARRRSA